MDIFLTDINLFKYYAKTGIKCYYIFLITKNVQFYLANFIRHIDLQFVRGEKQIFKSTRIEGMQIAWFASAQCRKFND